MVQTVNFPIAYDSIPFLRPGHLFHHFFLYMCTVGLEDNEKKNIAINIGPEMELIQSYLVCGPLIC